MIIFMWPPSSYYTIYKIISLTLSLFPYIISERYDKYASFAAAS
jgi:hypothetical protein